MKRAGIDVLWRENQAGCKGVCARVPTETLTGMNVPTFYPSTSNYDDILVDGLDDKIAKLEHDTVIVLHMMGSHGPAYWKRYPEKFETFTPVCKDSQFSRCKIQDIVNAYDNTLVYTDHVLTRLIGVLSGAAEPRRRCRNALRIRSRRKSRRKLHVSSRHAVRDCARSANPCADGRMAGAVDA